MSRRQQLIDAMVTRFAAITLMQGRVQVWPQKLPTVAECPCIRLWDTVAECDTQDTELGTQRHTLHFEAVVFLGTVAQGVAARTALDALLTAIGQDPYWSGLTDLPTRLDSHEIAVERFGQLAGAAKLAYTVEYVTAAWQN